MASWPQLLATAAAPAAANTTSSTVVWTAIIKSTKGFLVSTSLKMYTKKLPVPIRLSSLSELSRVKTLWKPSLI